MKSGIVGTSLNGPMITLGGQSANTGSVGLHKSSHPST